MATIIIIWLPWQQGQRTMATKYVTQNGHFVTMAMALNISVHMTIMKEILEKF